MEDSLALVTLPHASAAFNCEAAKLGFTKTTELESTMVFGLDAFEVDDLLEFFDKEIGPAIGEVELSDLSAESSVTIMAPEGAHTTYSSTKARSKSSYIRASDEEDHHLGTDYDFAELDWLSKFVEDSYSTGEHLKPDLFPAVSDKRPQMSTSADEMKITNPVSVLQNSNTNSAETSRLEINIPGRARTKRCRSGVRIWSSDILTSNSASQESSIYDTSFISFDSSELYSDLYSADSDGVGSRQDIDAVQLSKITKERKYRRKESNNTQNTRRCAHCLAERTPQWRAGPTGPKTLCNACGVRYKSGRLVPEYRPAASPTFLSDVHSNSHRKVLEMRRQKEINVCTNIPRIFKAN